ncbi:MAG: nicotinate-nucleotide adenylyltransferase [Hydrogenophilus sp.]|nr:nicotinate-nucleotide adenylyltransferase [Hydrogenophilus sp.]
MIGLLGGTFDPIHLAHLRLAEEARELLSLEQIWFIPSAAPPHRPPPAAAIHHRCEMIRRAIEGNPAFRLDARERSLPPPNYTIDTLSSIRAQLGPHLPLILLLGADAFCALPTWHRFEELLTHVHLAVATRPGYSLTTLHLPSPFRSLWENRCTPSYWQRAAPPPAGWILELPITPLAIAARDIRAARAVGRSIRYLLPDAVLEYIEANHLYTQEQL